MSGNNCTFLQRKMLNTNPSLVQIRASKHKRISQLRNFTKPLGIRNSLNLMHQLKVSEFIHKYLHLRHYNYSISSKPDSANRSSKRQLTNAPSFVIVPNHDLVGRKLRVGTTSDERQNITPEKHLHVANSAAVEFPAKVFSERIAIVDAKSVVSGGGETGSVLIEG